jgi:putative ABC transport system permease protein
VWWNPPVFPPGPATRLLVIGVARTLKESGPPAVMSVHLAAYVPLQQSYVSEMTLLARGHDRRLAGDLRALVRSMNPNLPILNAQTLEEQMTGPVEVQLRVAAAVAGSIGTVSVLLAAIGIYGVMAYAVTRRTREIGIRLALGARRADVLRMVVREGLALVAIGSGVGIMLAAAAGRVLTSVLVGVPPLDPAILSGTTVLFAIIGAGACYLPARRATRIDAMEALRYE